MFQIVEKSFPMLKLFKEVQTMVSFYESQCPEAETLRRQNEVRHIDLSWKNNHVSFSVNDLISGVYIYKYNIDGKSNSMGKLVIE